MIPENSVHTDFTCFFRFDTPMMEILLTVAIMSILNVFVASFLNWNLLITVIAYRTHLGIYERRKKINMNFL